MRLSVITHTSARCDKITETQSVHAPEADGDISMVVTAVTAAMTRGANGFCDAAACGSHFSNLVINWRWAQGENPAGKHFTQFGEAHINVRPNANLSDAQIIDEIRGLIRNTRAGVGGDNARTSESLGAQQQCASETPSNSFSDA